MSKTLPCNAGRAGSIPGQGTRFHMPWSAAKKKKICNSAFRIKFFFITNIDLNFDATFYEYFFINSNLNLLPGNKSQCPSGMKYSISYVSFFFFNFYLFMAVTDLCC